MQSKNLWIIGISVGVISCICLTTVLLATGVIVWRVASQQQVAAPATTDGVQPGPADQAPEPVDPNATPEPASTGAQETLSNLEAVQVPESDPLELAERLQGVGPVSRTVAPSRPHQVGDKQVFWASNTQTNETFQVTAVLRKVVDSAYFWIEEGLRYNHSDLERLATTFNDKIYPTDREFFGSEWSPGIDGDKRLYILYARNLGGSTAAYFSSVDELNPLVHRYSNAHEMFMVNADTVTLGEEYTYGVLAHELQHMIHWYNDRNEDTWVNEGFSELAAFLNGYDLGGFDYLFSLNPDVQLTDWPVDSDLRSVHYGSSFLFMAYFLDRFGEQATQSLVANPLNSMESVDAVLKELQAEGKIDGTTVTADAFFNEWTVTNLLNDPKFDNGRYGYHRYGDVPSFPETETVSACDGSWQNRMVSQYGADYIRIDCPGNVMLSFQGANEVGVISTGAQSGNYAFWSNFGDESDMSLARNFDLRKLSGKIDFNYSVWYDLEQDYDFVYLSASTDGKTWTMLNPPGCNRDNLTGNNYGCGYNGKSGGYRQETIDLSEYAGKEVTLRFDYVTDAAVTAEGLLIDDVAIPQLGYASDFEQNDGGWQANGFVRIENRLPQSFQVTIVEKGSLPKVQTLTLDSTNRAVVTLDNPRAKDLTVIVSGITRFTREKANYAFSAALQP